MRVLIIPEANGFHVDVYYLGPLGRTYTLDIWREPTEGAAFEINSYSFTPGLQYPGQGVQHTIPSIPFTPLPFSAQFHFKINGIEDIEAQHHQVQLFFHNPAAPVNGYIPLRGPGAHTVKSFPKLNMIAIENGRFRVSDLDFINVQALSMSQAAAKARRIAALTDLSGTLILQSGGIESAARPAGRFKDAMNEIARVIEFATEEVRNQQKFDITNVELVRYL